MTNWVVPLTSFILNEHIQAADRSVRGLCSHFSQIIYCSQDRSPCHQHNDLMMLSDPQWKAILLLVE